MLKKATSLLIVAVLCASLAAPAFAAPAEAVKAADRLHELGLFNGVGVSADGTPNYDLDRSPNRMETVTLLVRLLGKEAEALSGAWTIPFTDVADWARPYVGYAFVHGLTSGMSATKFNGTDTVSAAQYLTFVLRALGYSSDGDFAWSTAWELTDKLGVTSGQYGAKSAFTRSDAVTVSAKALDQKLKDGGKTLLQAILEELANAPETQLPDNSGQNAARTYLVNAEADVAGFDEQKPVSLKLDIRSAREAVFTYTFEFPVAGSTVYDVIFSVSGEKYVFGHYFSGEFYAYKQGGSGESGQDRFSDAVFSDTNAEDGLVTWRVVLPADCPFSFDLVSDDNITCDVYYLGAR